MNEFRGTGAECMVQFNKDGRKGSVVYVEEGKAIVKCLPELGLVDWNSDMCSLCFMWLDEECIYYPPEPVWREVTPGQALDAMLAGKHVQAQHRNEPENWWVANLDSTVWRYADSRRFRIEED